MSDYILFINSGSDRDVALKVYKVIPKVKIRVNDASKLHKSFKETETKVWIDPSFDGYGGKPVDDSSWSDFMSKFSEHEKFFDPAFINKPLKKDLEKHVEEVMDACMLYKPDILSVPQLPYVVGTANNSVNKALCIAFLKWKTKNGFKGDVILPVILTHKDAVTNGSERTKKIDYISKNYSLSGANGVWVVDSSLQDQAGTGNFEKERFPSLIDLHARLNESFKPQIHIAGPYWGLNILLWAKNIITNPAFSLGAGFQHYLPGGRINQPSPRVAIPPLKRWAKVNKDFKDWLSDSITKLAGQKDGLEFEKLLKEVNKLEISTRYKYQISEFYLAWYETYASLPASGRSLALYQDLSQAFVLGKSLENIGSELGTARRPEVIAKQLMLNCF